MNPNKKKGIILIIFICVIGFFGALQSGLIPFHGSEMGYLSQTFSLDWQDIAKIEITYAAEHDDSFVYRFYKIVTIDGTYYSNTGEKIDSEVIQFLTESFTDFYESEPDLHEDYSLLNSYPYIAVVVTLHNKDTIILTSDSDCHCFIPWNIEYDDTLYVQYNGKIPTALLRILIEVDRELWSSCDKEARWGCYPGVVPDEYAQEGRSSRFPRTEPIISPAEEEGKKHVLWQISLKEVGALDYGNGNVVVTLNDRVISLDAETGVTRWEVAFAQRGESCNVKNVLVHDGVVYVGAPDSWLYSIDGETGAVLWKYKTNASTHFPLRIAGNTLAAVTGGITLLDTKTGAPLMEITEDTWNEVFYEDKILFAGLGDDSESYYALLDIESGEIVWKEDFFDIQYPVYHEGFLYYARPEVNAFFSFDVDSPEEWLLYTYDRPIQNVKISGNTILLVVLSENENVLQDLVIVIPAESKIKRYTEQMSSDADIKIYRDILFFLRKGGFIEAFNMESGKRTWETEIRGTEIISFTVYEDSIYMSANDGTIYCLELETGKTRWMTATNVKGAEAFVYICVVEDGFLFAVTGTGDLYVFSV